MDLRSAVAKAATFSMLALGFVNAASANITLLTPTGTWNSPVKASQNGTDAFWDNVSTDNGNGGHCDVGYILEGHSNNCLNNAVISGAALPGKALTFLTGGSATTPDSDFSFTGSGGTSTFVATITGNAGETIGYTSNGVNHVLATNGGSQVSQQFTITPGSSFSFYVSSASGTFNTVTAGQQFALFVADPSSPTGNADNTSLNSFYLGAEDTAISANGRPNGDRDYNDIVIEVTATPEPGFYGSLAVGFSALVFAVKRRRKA